VTTLRRWDGQPFVFVALIAVGVPVILIANWPLPAGRLIGVLAVALSGLVILYVSGPAASISVTSKFIILDNTFQQYVVPRAELVKVAGPVSPDLVLRDGTSIAIVAFEPSLVGSTSRGRGTYRRKVNQLARALEEIPEVASDDQLVIHKRSLNIALTCLSLITGFGGMALMVIGGKG
jgi:hypothetical protein